MTLQRAKTAREAIAVMDDLCQTYGYASDGESFSIADGNEVWLMELVGKGKNSPAPHGAVWVASRVPDGYIGSTANQARTRTFPRGDPASCLFSKDVVSFAQQQGLYPKGTNSISPSPYLSLYLYLPLPLPLSTVTVAMLPRCHCLPSTNTAAYCHRHPQR